MNKCNFCEKKLSNYKAKRCRDCYNKKICKTIRCSKCEAIGGYKCQHDYWYETLYLTIRDFIRNLRRD